MGEKGGDGEKAVGCREVEFSFTQPGCV